MAVAAVREAEAGDASAMAAVQLDVWRTAYADFVPAEVLSAVDYESATRAWKLAIISAGPAYVLVATEGSEVVGFAAGAGSEVSALVVAPRWTRRGHGGRLLGTLAERLRSGGSLRGEIWVAEGDAAARAFFPGHGWAPDGTVRTSHHGARVLRELRHTGALRTSWE
jgi:GNAT superfamily N-acetyltransferase